MANTLDLRIFDEKEIVPNGKIDDLVTAALRLFESSTLRGYTICCYLFFGITDLLEVKQAQGYREVILRSGGDRLLSSKIDWALKTLKEKGVVPVMCTFPPMSFAKHNQFLLKNGLTGKLEHKGQYQTMQAMLNEQVANLNKKIEELNCESGVITCQLSAKLFVQERGRHILKDVYLRDGLHPTNQGATLLNVELAQNLRKAKQGKRSPEWLKKSHQIKSGSKISFGLKLKKDEPGGKALDRRLKPAVPAVASVSTLSKSRSPLRQAHPLGGRGRRSYSPERQRSPRRRSRSPRRRSRSPRRRSRSPRHRSRSPRRHNRSPKQRTRSPGYRVEKSENLASNQYDTAKADRFQTKPVQSAMETPATSIMPQYKSVPVPKPSPGPIPKPTVEDKKQGSFALSAFLGALSGGNTGSNKDSASEASMSMSPPGPEPDPDIVVITDERHPSRSSPSLPQSTDNMNKRIRSRSRDRRRSRSHGRRRSRSRDRQRTRSRDRQRTRSRDRQRRRSRSPYRRDSRVRRRSRSRSRRSLDRFQSRNPQRRQSPSRSRKTADLRHLDSDLDEFGRSKSLAMGTMNSAFDAGYTRSASTLLGERPSNLLGDRPTNLLGDRPADDFYQGRDDSLVRLAQEQKEVTGESSYGQLQTLANLNQLSSGVNSSTMKLALELQKQALAQKMSGSIQQEKKKLLKMIEAEKKKDDPFERALSHLQAGFSEQQSGPNYGYGFAAQFQSQQSQPARDFMDMNSRGYEFSRHRSDRDEMDRYAAESNRGGYGGYE